MSEPATTTLKGEYGTTKCCFLLCCKEAEEEEHSKQQEAESLGLASEDCTEESISDEDSGLDSVSEDEF